MGVYLDFNKITGNTLRDGLTTDLAVERGLNAELFDSL